MPRLQLYVLYLVVPLLLAITNGLRGQLPDKSLSLLFWIVHGMPIFVFDGIGSYLVMRVLRPWRPALGIITILGAVIATFFEAIYTRLIFLMTGPLFHGINDPARAPSPGFTLPFLRFYVEMFLGGILLWTAINYYYDRVLGYARYRYPAPAEPPAATAAAMPIAAPADAEKKPATEIVVERLVESPAHSALSSGSPHFMSRMPAELGSELIAIEAQEHYIKVFTSLGNSLILYRFQDAVAELQGMPGLRVHRSFWVMRDAIVAVKPRGKACEIELVNGLRLPVSQTYKGSLEGLLLPKRHARFDTARTLRRA